MIEEILPSTVVAVEAFGDHLDAALHPEEEAVLGRAVEKRRREFTTGRSCAHRALELLGVCADAIPSGSRGEPLWPSGAVGSITHCDNYRACAVASSADIVTIGIDAEPHEQLPDGLLPDIARPEEMRWLTELSHAAPTIHWDRLLFSAKESIYKAWFPLMVRWLGFEDATLTLDLGQRTFSARLLVPGPSLGGAPVSWSGRWLVRDGLVLTATAIATS